MSGREDQSDGKLESGRHRWTDEENESVKSAFETAIKEKSINIQINGERHYSRAQKKSVKSTRAKYLTK